MRWTGLMVGGLTVGGALGCGLMGRDATRSDRTPPVDAGEGAPASTPPAPKRLTPAQSAAARPVWARATDYAPQAPSEVLFHATAVSGTTDIGLVGCEVTSTLKEGRFLRRNQLPDLQGTLAVQGHEVNARAEDNMDRLVLTAPLMALDDTSTLTLSVFDRQLLKTRHLGSMSAGYTGLPVTMTGDQMAATCVYVAADQLGTLAAPLIAAGVLAAEAWRPQPQLDAAEVAPVAEGAQAITDIEHAAGLLGWADPRLAAPVATITAAHSNWLTALRAELVTARLASEGGVTLAGITWSPATLLQGPALAAAMPDYGSDAWRVVVPARASGVDVDVTGLDMVDRAQLVGADGTSVTMRVSGIQQGKDVVYGTIDGDAATVWGPVFARDSAPPAPPLVLRLQREGTWALIAVD